MMREKGFSRERNSHSWEQEGNRFSDGSSYGVRKDFRDGLVSIFIGNLNPVVDSMGLWGIFKVFEKVRDVFLSSKQNFNGGCFAFIRFGTLEEADKVAQRVNGMHVYGWPIVAKLAAHDWNRRRSYGRSQIDRERFYYGRDRTKERGEESGREDVKSKLQHQIKLSYAEVTKEDIPKEQQVKYVMSWSGSVENEEWLAKSAIGVLKEFASVESVNQKLEDRGFSFSSSYMGRKCIIWSFESVCDRDGFINNKFFWNDCFISMSRWKDSSYDWASNRFIKTDGLRFMVFL